MDAYQAKDGQQVHFEEDEGHETSHMGRQDRDLLAQHTEQEAATAKA